MATTSSLDVFVEMVQNLVEDLIHLLIFLIAQHVEQSGPVLRDLLLASRDLLIQLELDEGIELSFEKKNLFMICNTDYRLSKEIGIAMKTEDLGITAEVLSPDEVKK